MSFYSPEELRELGFAGVGDDVRLSRRASIYNPGRIRLANHVRIDDFTVLSAGEGGIEIGDYVHISVFCSLIGSGRITLGDFSGLSSRVSIHSSSDDFSGRWMTNPTVPGRYTHVRHADVTIGRHVIIGSGAVVLPGVVIDEGAAIGALSLVNKHCDGFQIFSGIPARRIGERRKDLLDLEALLRAEEGEARPPG
ncbi:MAG: acyltransferase [Methylotetracoccus sp.]